MSFHLSPRRLLGAVALGGVAVLALAGPASAAAPGPAAAATWLTGSLVDGNHVVIGGFAYDGTAADTLYALVATGGQDATVQKIDAYLKTDIADYADPAGTAGGPYSGSLSKLALVAETLGEDPHAYGGTDLLKVLTDKLCTAVDPAPQFKTCNAPGEFYNAFSPVSQALGVMALQRSPVAADRLTATSAPFVRLLDLRCADGLFSGSLLAPGATCTTGDADTTAYAAQALAAVLGADDPAVTTTLTALAKIQDPSGGFGGASGINTNSAGVALSAFSVQPTAFAAAIAKGAAFVEGLQRPDGAYAATAADAGKPATEQTDLAKQATPQALLGVVGRNLAGIVAAPPVTTPPTSTAPTSGTPAPVTASNPELANTGVANGHLTTELLLAGVALAGGVVALRVGSSRLPVARHRG